MPNSYENAITYHAEVASVVAGDIGTPSRVGVTLYQIEGGVKVPYTGKAVIRAWACNSGTFANSTNGTIAALTGNGTVLTTHTSNKDLSVIRPTAGVLENRALTITALLHGETITIGGRVYQVDGGPGIASSADYAIDISSYGTKAQGTLTIAEPVSVGDTMTLGSKTYTFVAGTTASIDGEINLGSGEAETKAAIVEAVNGTDGVNNPNPEVTIGSFTADDAVVTAILAGPAGNSEPSTDTFTNVSNTFDATALGTTTTGVAPTATNLGDAVTAAITADHLSPVTASNIAGVVTAVSKVYGNNAMAVSETSAGASWASATLTGGSPAPGEQIVFTLTDGVGSAHTLRFSTGDRSVIPFEGAEIEVDHS